MDAQEISVLSDDDLYAKLLELGGIVSPIVSSTRGVHERQLFKLLHGISFCDSSQESDDEPEHDMPVGEDIYLSSRFSPSSTSSPQTVSGSEIEFRHRPIRSYAEANDGIYFDRTSLTRSSYRSDLQTAPANEIKFQHASKQSPSSSQKSKMPVALLVVVFFIIVLVVLVYVNMESNSINPIPELY